MSGTHFTSRGSTINGYPFMVVILLAEIVTLLGCHADPESPVPELTRQEKDEGAFGRESMSLTVVYDNYKVSRNLTADWGFACVVQGLDRTILFDTGGDGRILLANMRALEIEPEEIDVVVISHAHGDHTGGLGKFLSLKPDTEVVIPSGFSPRAQAQIRAQRGKVIEADESLEICPGAKTTGTLGKRSIVEQGLCVSTDSAWALITGCAHPGVTNMAAQAKEVMDGPISLVIGGYHMLGEKPPGIERVIDRFEQLGVKRLAPCHCTGDQAREMFKEHFGDRCTLAGVGTVFSFSPQKAHTVSHP